LKFTATPDILAAMGARKRDGQYLAGFSLETDPARLESDAKMQKKNLDLLIANNPSKPGSEFGGDTNDAILFLRGGQTVTPGLISKAALADLILDRVAAGCGSSTRRVSQP
jgi:phosphopantothenoylcysteine decarboxylase/phosphopantothenate--cysteine ligase